MKKNIIKQIFKGALLCVACLGINSCTEDIDQSNRYTFTGETIADYLENRPEIYSNFLVILNQADMLGLLSSYGTYTCLAPTNEAIEKFLVEKDSIYWANVAALEAGEITQKDFVETGIHSPRLEDLTDSMAVDIARTHLIELGYLTTDIGGDIIPTMNMNDRYLSLMWTVDSNGATQAVINNSSVIVIKDSEAENGVIQTLDAVLSPSTSLLPDLIKSQDYFSIFSEALLLTGMDDSLRLYKDESYDMAGKTSDSFDIPVTRQCPYPKTAYFKYSAFVETNEVFAQAGIYDIDDLIEYANKWYGSDYYDVVDLDNYTSRDNPLNRFISYHLIDRQLFNATGTGGFIMQGFTCSYSGFNSEINLRAGFDRYDYFATMLPHTLVKVTKPLSNTLLKNDLVLNYAQDAGSRLYNTELANNINVIVLPESTVTATEGMEGYTQSALNGIIHCIDRILIYNEDEMAGNVLNERMRWDFSSLFSELTNNGIRWSQKTSTEQEYRIPDGYCKNITINSTDCHIYYLCPTGGSTDGWTNYQGDEFIASKQYDFTYKLPPVPAGNYEIRFGYNRNSNRGVAQFYVDGKVTGIPVDLRTNTYTTNLVGWVADPTDEADIIELDKAMRNRGYMKAPDNYCPTSGFPARRSSSALRKIVTTLYLGEGDHFIRFKNVLEGDDGGSQFMHDYLEIVPKGVISDPSNPEDRH